MRQQEPAHPRLDISCSYGVTKKAPVLEHNGDCALCACLCILYAVHSLPQTTVSDTLYQHEQGSNGVKHPGGFPQRYEKNPGGLHRANKTLFTQHYLLYYTVARALLYAAVNCICE